MSACFGWQLRPARLASAQPYDPGRCHVSAGPVEVSRVSAPQAPAQNEVASAATRIIIISYARPKRVAAAHRPRRLLAPHRSSLQFTGQANFWHPTGPMTYLEWRGPGIVPRISHAARGRPAGIPLMPRSVSVRRVGARQRDVGPRQMGRSVLARHGRPVQLVSAGPPSKLNP